MGMLAADSLNLEDLADACAALITLGVLGRRRSTSYPSRHRFAVQPYCRDVVSVPEPTQGTHSSTVKKGGARGGPNLARVRVCWG